MSYKTLSVEIEGAAPLLMHNGQTADPLNKFSKALKKVTGKRNKTDDDHEEVARIEFLAGLYVNETGSPCVPGEVLEATMMNGAKVSRNGKKFKAGVIIDGDFSLEYSGPKNPDELVADERFRHKSAVKVGTAKVMRTRPMFRQWKLKFDVNYLGDVINESEVLDAIKAAGETVGLCDGRPRFGRFNVISAK